MTIKDDVLRVIQQHPGWDDDQIAARLGVSRVQVNQQSRQLVAEGKVWRSDRQKIQNYPIPRR